MARTRVDEIRETGRNAQGVKLMTLDARAGLSEPPSENGGGSAPPPPEDLN